MLAIRNCKQTLVDYVSARLSAMMNCPGDFEEFENKLDQVLFVSATPGDYEYDHELHAEQTDPSHFWSSGPTKVEVRLVEGQT